MALSSSTYAAIDLGAASGRIFIGTLDSGRLVLREIYRFSNEAVFINGSWRWDVLALFGHMKAGICKATSAGYHITSLSVDSWGVDYVLLRGELPHLSPPYSYRDTRTEKPAKRLRDKLGDEFIYSHTGIQLLHINTIYQLSVDAQDSEEMLSLADGFLTIGDYFNWVFSGKRAIERSLASTTQLYDPSIHDWSDALIEAAGLRRSLFPPLVDSGTVLDSVRPELIKDLGLRSDAKIVSTCSHDTAAAVVGAPIQVASDTAFLSSGTWSLLGVELPNPILTTKMRVSGFTNEVGYGRTILLLKNITGMWILEECRRDWARGGASYDYDMLIAQAAQIPSCRTFVFPNAPRFLSPGNMLTKISNYCRETGQPVPGSPAEVVRCIIDSLAMLYAVTIGQLEEATGRNITLIHIVGGGSQNQLLNQATANACDRRVIAGPVEAAALGNLLIQADTFGEINGLEEMRQIVRNSVVHTDFPPSDSVVWAAARKTFLTLALDNQI